MFEEANYQLKRMSLQKGEYVFKREVYINNKKYGYDIEVGDQ